MPAPVALRGRPSNAHLADLAEAERTAREELASRSSETLRLIDHAWPHVDALVRCTQELGPVALKHALSVAGVLRRIEAQATPADDAAEELVAA